MPYNIITHDSIVVNRRRKIKSRSALPNERQGASTGRWFCFCWLNSPCFLTRICF